jgi:DMSO reductase family type II enzyme molybdopterin subunit
LEEGVPVNSITRRSFLVGSGAAVLGLSLSRLSFAAPAEAAASGKATDYTSWDDLYRQQWRWDKIVHSSHNCNCNNACSWKVYVKDGIAWREEQTAAYEQTVDGLADFNPQGCQKGASYSHEMYAASRLRHPLKRVGERGSGRWKRISWDQALTEVATKLVEIVRDDGGDTIIAFSGTQAPTVPGHFVDLIGGVGIEPYGEIGDSFNGTIMTTGHQVYDGGSDTRMYSKCIISWVYNPNVTRIPDAHHINEARYNGATVISISPDLNPSHVHADLWINPKIGTDTALGLAMANIIVRDKLYDEAHMKEQTDLPFLVREDTKRFLRASDLEADGSEDVFYVWDTRTDRPVQPPGCMGSPNKTLRLGDIDPALEGRFEVRLRDGSTVTVHTVFERLKGVLEEHTPEFAESVTGVRQQTIERLTREYATRKPALIMIGWGIGKFYHSDLLQRAILLLTALTGNMGTLGGGFWNGGILINEGAMPAPLPGRKGSRVCPGAPWLYVHGGIREKIGSRWVPTPGEKSGDDYIMEAIEKFWMPVYPRPGKDPRCLIECGSNLLRRTRGNNILLEHLWPKLKLVLTIDFNMSSSAVQSDYVLPAAGYYETEGIKYQDTKVPYITIKSKAVDPIGESKSDYAIFALLAKKVSELAPGMGVEPYFDDVLGIERDLTKLYDEFTEDGKYTEDADEREMVRRVMAGSKLFEGVTLEEFEEKGQMPWPNQGFKARGTLGPTSDYEPGKPYTPALDFVEGKEPWSTLTGRQQFYIDHEWFLEFGEELPVYREPPRMGGDYPLLMTCGHTRWGIHSWMRDNSLMLRLQRGEPLIYMNPRDADARDIRDNELVEMFNDVSSAKVRVMVTPTMQHGQVHIYHAWETFQFADGKSHSGVYATQLKPLNMVGNYGQMFYAPGYYQPNNIDKGNTIEVRKL